MRSKQKLVITYMDGSGVETQRAVWPFALVYFDQARVLMCWSELRNAFANFRADRILATGEMPALLREWSKVHQEAAQSILPESGSTGI